ncbi:MAG TPA: hypothetical protein DCZ94_15345 [Lentisphaeria bacterium]|nr:MAG: hypothetical protein A2X48_17265 [Lentisphaerae bacterium GWF2_49_21]HBC88326.1 hypothetical protein [Lentisphaeria bacterium]
MLCEICHKNEATIHIQEIINSQKKALHICQDCASKKNTGNGIFNGLNLADILYNISSNISSTAPDAEKIQDKTVTPVPVITCGKCGWTTAKFSEKGRIGCANCYNVFRDILSLALKNMHKGTLHVGKRPGARRPEDEEAGRNAIEIMKLQKQLEEHVIREEYEKAAQIRDRISTLKSKNKKSR